MLINPLNVLLNATRPNIANKALLDRQVSTAVQRLKQKKSDLLDQQKTYNQAGLDSMAGLADAVNHHWLA